MRRSALLLVAIATMAPRPSGATPQHDDSSASIAAMAPSQPLVRMDVETSKMGGEADTTRKWVLRDGGAALNDAGVRVTDADAEITVRVIIEPEDLGYTVMIEIWDVGAQQATHTRGPKICEDCTRTELIQLVQRELAWVAGWLSIPSEEAKPPAEDETDDEALDDPMVTEPTVEPEPLSDQTPPRQLHALGWAGIGLGAVGVGSVVGGLVVAVRTYEARGEPGDYRVPLVERPKRAGWAMVGVGAAAMVGGTLMVIFDLRKSRRARALSAGPWLDRRAGGLSIQGRF